MTRLLAFALALAAFFPVAASAGQTVLTPTRVIYPGETVSADAVEAVEMRRARPPKGAVATAVAEVAGKIAKRTLVPGKLIPVSALREAFLIQQGAPVQAVFAAGSLRISITAVPLEPGAAGDFVRLRNPDSGKVFSGTVMADGSVRVSGE